MIRLILALLFIYVDLLVFALLLLVSLILWENHCQHHCGGKYIFPFAAKILKLKDA